MKQCHTCGLYLEDQVTFCPRCGMDMTHVPPIPPQAMPQNPTPLAQPPRGPVFVPPQLPARKPFTWADVSTFLGFCASIVGYFGASLLFFISGFQVAPCSFALVVPGAVGTVDPAWWARPFFTAIVPYLGGESNRPI